jgi:hypothetical protein
MVEPALAKPLSRARSSCLQTHSLQEISSVNDNFRRLLPAFGALALVQATHAATLTVKTAPPGINVPQLQQQLAALTAADKQQFAIRAQQMKTQMTNALSAIEPERKALSAALDADPRYKGFLDQARRIGTGAGDAATRAAQLKALVNANRVIFDDAIRSAKISSSVLQSKVPGSFVAPDLSFRFKSPAPAMTKASILSGPSSATPPSIPDLVMQPPFDFESTDTSNGGLAYQAVVSTANPDDGTTRVHATIIGVAGGASGEAEVGKIVAIPTGVKRVEVVISAKTSYAASALSALSASSGCADTAVEVFTADLQHSLGGDGDFQCVMAPLAWYAEMSGDETRDHTFSFNVTNDSRNILIRADAHTNAIGAGVPGYADALAKADITKIRVRFFND